MRALRSFKSVTFNLPDRYYEMHTLLFYQKWSKVGNGSVRDVLAVCVFWTNSKYELKLLVQTGRN